MEPTGVERHRRRSPRRLSFRERVNGANGKRCDIDAAKRRSQTENWEFESINRSPSNLSKAGWSWGCVSAISSNGRTIWIVDAHRDDGRRFIVHADEKLTAFLELERAVCIHLLSEQC